MIFSRKSLVLSALALLGSQNAIAFTPSTLFQGNVRLSTKLYTSESVDVDAAARLEYDAWRKKYNKGAFNEKKFLTFKENYEAITVANVIAARQRREGKDAPKAMVLNEYADMTEEEYFAAKSGGGSDALSGATQAAAAQSKAASALGEASAALAEEEQVRSFFLSYILFFIFVFFTNILVC